MATFVLAAALAGARVVAAEAAEADETAEGTGAAVGSGASAAGDSATGPSYGAVGLPILFYSPETKMGGGAFAILHRRDDSSADTHPSSLVPLLLYTQKKQIVTNLSAEVVGRANRWVAGASVGFVDFPTSFWGIGVGTPDAAEERYTRRALHAGASWKRRIAGSVRAGLGFDWEHSEVRDREEGGALVSGRIPGGEDERISGGSLILDWDTRDNTFAPAAGVFHEAVVGLARRSVGSTRDFEMGRVDLRAYRGSAARGVVALQLVYVATTGNVPYQRYAVLGGSKVMRGYYEGRYLHRQGGALQTEYRSPLRNRVGVVVCAAVGGVAGTAAAWRRDELLGSGGFGFRWALDPKERINLRLDLGFGSRGSQFYMDIGEAF